MNGLLSRRTDKGKYGRNLSWTRKTTNKHLAITFSYQQYSPLEHARVDAQS